jgi:hypothetical protein
MTITVYVERRYELLREYQGALQSQAPVAFPDGDTYSQAGIVVKRVLDTTPANETITRADGRSPLAIPDDNSIAKTPKL